MLKRAFQLTIVCIVAITALGASDTSRRFEKLGHEMVCQCGCGQILLECNHVGCPVSAPMIHELHSQLDAGLNNTAVLNFFTNKYGPIVLAAPIRGGFDLVAWIVPIVAALLCTFGVIWLLRRWQSRRRQVFSGDVPPASPSHTNDALTSRIRRDTDYENWGGGNR